MNWLMNTLIIGFSAAVATTFDDNIYLTAFFGKINRTFRPKHIILGEYVGFSVLVFASLPGYFGSLIIPEIWIGLLGFLPILIGITHLISREDEQYTVQTVSVKLPSRTKFKYQNQSLWKTIKDPQTYRVSAATIANGGNNIGIYVPLFASSSFHSLSIILFVCYLTVGLWCFLSFHLTRNPLMTPVLTRYGRKIFPFILIWLGLTILIENKTYQLLPNIAVFSN
ncbi:cadmium resistance transporter [Stanieria cyanosphaera PCC 7437]|uniref:Cadmium resistance transporter n=1 Tax=Stanieria cyanosphaera (strain ATCC 29371 / PCC 7437) TaxID=111780 RepID=K9XWC1_STAC7|nr:cadmium resistance transporter [Stanieria cyanosphaera]AFZ36381.1 cadmium resistance transporter [Stanieria cyanosphaera PCC 7437]